MKLYKINNRWVTKVKNQRKIYKIKKIIMQIL